MHQRQKGILLNYATMLFKLIIGLFFTPFMLEKLGDSEYGILSLANSFIIFITILDCGFGQTLIRYQTKNQVHGEEKNTSTLNGLFLKLYIYVSLLASLFGFGIMMLYPIACAGKLTPSEIGLFQKVFFVLLVNTVLTFPLRIFSADLQVHEHFSFFKGVNLALLILRYVSMALLLVKGFHVLSLAVVISATSLLTQLFYMVYCIHKLSFKLSFEKIDPILQKEILTFSFFIFINLVVDFLYDNTDKLLLGAIKGTAAVTMYTMGVAFYSYFKLLSTSISGVYMPKIVSLYETQNDMRVISQLFEQVGRLQLFILMLVINLYILLGKPFLTLWIGSGYEDAFIVGLLIMVPAVIPLSQNLGQSILRAMNLHRYRSYMYLTIAILNVIMTIPLANKYGPIGAALATCIATVVGEILFLNWFYAVKAQINLKPYWIIFLKLLGLSMILDACANCMFKFLAISKWNWAILTLAGIIYLVVYCVLFYFFLASDYEKKLIRKMLNIVQQTRQN